MANDPEGDRQHVRIVTRARPDMRLTQQPDGTLLVSRGERRLTLRRLSVGQRAAVDRLFPDGGTDDELAAPVDREGTEQLAVWYWQLQMLARLGGLEYAAVAGERSLAVLIPLSTTFRMQSAPVDPERRYLLSTFAFVHRVGLRFVVESPLAVARVECEEEGLVVLRALASAQSWREVRAAIEPAVGAEQVLSLLVSAGLVQPCDDAEVAIDREPRALGWSFVDALFHFRSRSGRHEAWYGAKPESERGPAPPPVKPPMHGQRVVFERPNLDRLATTDPPLAAVMEARHSIRQCGRRPVTSHQLGELLFRTARVRPHPVWKELDTSRPYPSGGACYPLELYVAVERCDGVEPGLYYYAPLAHELVRLAVSPETVSDLLDDYRDRGVDDLQIVIIMAARVSRVSWKYASVVYATILKEVGVLMQSLYLVATAMGLAPCAIGGGASELLSRATGIDPLEEATVGEFAIGSRP